MMLLIRPETINLVLVKMFGESEKTESTLLGGISILQTLLLSTKFKLVITVQLLLFIKLIYNFAHQR